MMSSTDSLSSIIDWLATERLVSSCRKKTKRSFVTMLLMELGDMTAIGIPFRVFWRELDWLPGLLTLLSGTGSIIFWWLEVAIFPTNLRGLFDFLLLLSLLY